MKRTEILDQYEVNEAGVIKSPGKFFGEMLYVPHFWDSGLNGCYTFDTGSVYGFEVDEDDLKEFPELSGVKFVLCEESEQGFVYAETRDTVVDESEFEQEDEDTYEVVVGNIGSVYTGNNAIEAQRTFDEYCEQSSFGVGRAGNEHVCLLLNGQVWQELDAE